MFETTGYLGGQAKSASVPSGFLVVERKPGEAVLMTPYCVYYDLMDDGMSPSWTRSPLMRTLKHNTLSWGFPFAPGFKSIFLGAPYAEPGNRLFTRPGFELEHLAGDKEIRRAYFRGLVRLQLEHLAPLVSHFAFIQTAGTDAFLASGGFERMNSWPENYLNFNALRTEKRHDFESKREEAAAKITPLEAQETEQKAAENEVLLRLQAQTQVSFAQHEKKLIEAAEAQTQIQNLEEGIRRDAANASKKERPLAAAKQRQATALTAMGLNSWTDIPDPVRTDLFVLIDQRKAMKDTASQLRNARDTVRKAEESLSAFVSAGQKLTFEDYIAGLQTQHHRSAMRRNMKDVADTAAEYPVEILRTPEEILPLIDAMYSAYLAQYGKAKTQWMRMTPDYLRLLARLPGTEVVTCWHVTGGERKFAGFIFNLEGKFNHRMGIIPEYNNPDDKHLVYFRLTLRNIEENMNAGHDGMWIAQTTYQMKRRLGFQPQPLYTYRRGMPGFHRFANFMYNRVMGRIYDGTDELYDY